MEESDDRCLRSSFPPHHGGFAEYEIGNSPDLNILQVREGFAVFVRDFSLCQGEVHVQQASLRVLLAAARAGGHTSNIALQGYS
jgi:hypothetical protein